MFSVADVRRFIAAGLVVIMFRIMNDLPSLHIKGSSRVMEHAVGGAAARGATGVGFGARARVFHFGGHEANDGNALKMGGPEVVNRDVAAGTGDTGSGKRTDGTVTSWDAYKHDGMGMADDNGAIGGSDRDNGELHASQDDVAREHVAAQVQRAAENIFIPTVPDDHEEMEAIAADRPCSVTSNCTHWRDWLRMPQDVLLTHKQVRGINRILEENKDEDPLTTRQRFTVEVWDPRRRYNPALPNKPMHVIPMEATFLHFLPAEDLVRKKHETCAVVGNAGTMLHSGLGPYIDAHEAVIRINYAPTRGFERDVGTKTTYDLSNKENSGKLGDGTYQWRNSTLLLSEGHSSVVRKNAYRLLVPASLGRGDSRSGQMPRSVRFLSMSLVSMSRFTWFAIKAELEDRINQQLQQGLQRSLGARGAAEALNGGMNLDQMAQLQQGILDLQREQQGSSLNFNGRRRRRRAAVLRRRILELLEENSSSVGSIASHSGGSQSELSNEDGNSGGEAGQWRRETSRRRLSEESAESILASLSSMVDNVPDDMGEQLKHVGQQFKYNPKPMTGMVAVYFALQVCKKVDLYGFQAYRGRKRGAPPYHYFDRRQGMTWVHSFDLAVEAFREMGKYNHLFLRDKENPM